MPKPRRQLVPRPRLIDNRLDDPATMPRLVLVAAPAGFGKTTVLVQWLTATGAGGAGAGGAGAAPPQRRVAWLSLDAEDSEVTRFLTHLVAALRNTSPNIGSDALAVLEAPGSSVATDVLVSLVNDLDTVAGPTIIALDDYHFITTAAVHEAVTFLLDNLPPQVTLAITTRSDPPLPLARLRARDELVELRAADLRFTESEAEGFLNDVMGLGLEPEHVEALETRTEGWIAGLQLAALSARSRVSVGDVNGFVDAFSGSHRFVLDYLVEEVLSSEPEDVRTFLLETSVLRELSGPLCNAVTGQRTGRQMLQAFERSNLFLVPLDDKLEWFRYHQLFADALRAQLISSDPARAVDLHLAAAHWYADQARLSDAIRHALEAGSTDRAADLVELAIPGIRRHRQDRDLRIWLRALPEEDIRRRPLLATFVGWVHLSEGDLDAAETWLDQAEQVLDSSRQVADAPMGRREAHERGDQGSAAMEAAVRDRENELRVLPATIEVYRASIAQARGDLTGVIEHARRAGERSGPHDHLARSGAAGFLGMAQWSAGDVGQAIESFDECVHCLHAAGDVADELGSTVVIASLWLARGRPEEARRRYERALEAAERSPGAALSVTGDLHVGLAGILHEQAELDEAAKHLQMARELGDRASLIENRFRWYAVTAGLYRTQGDLPAAVAMLEQAEALYLHGFYPDTHPLPASIARLRIAQNRLADAWDWATRHAITPDQKPTYLAEYNLLTLARLLVAQYRVDGDPAGLDTAIALLDRVVAAAEASARGGSMIESLLVRALTRHASGEAQAASVDLSRALVPGVPAGYVRLFLDEGPAVEELLQTVAAGGEQPMADLAEALLRTDRAGRAGGSALDQELEAPTVTRTDKGADLSEREREVLRLLATELTGPQIAEHLFVSVNTLRSHCKHIFTKLGVNTRRAAVARATDLRLL